MPDDKEGKAERMTINFAEWNAPLLFHPRTHFPAARRPFSGQGLLSRPPGNPARPRPGRVLTGWTAFSQTHTDTTRTGGAASPLTSRLQRAHVGPGAGGQGHTCLQRPLRCPAAGGEEEDTSRLGVVPKHKDDTRGSGHVQCSSHLHMFVAAVPSSLTPLPTPKPPSSLETRAHATFSRECVQTLPAGMASPLASRVPATACPSLPRAPATLGLSLFRSKMFPPRKHQTPSHGRTASPRCPQSRPGAPALAHKGTERQEGRRMTGHQPIRAQAGTWVPAQARPPSPEVRGEETGSERRALLLRVTQQMDA